MVIALIVTMVVIDISAMLQPNHIALGVYHWRRIFVNDIDSKKIHNVYVFFHLINCFIFHKIIFFKPFDHVQKADFSSSIHNRHMFNPILSLKQLVDVLFNTADYNFRVWNWSEKWRQKLWQVTFDPVTFLRQRWSSNTRRSRRTCHTCRRFSIKLCQSAR